ncbi:helix-turn-helix domain-containing protein [Microbacterium sp. PRF11]|uniref:PucR family transcriptional regulator n=1 Tax=Microbacterium sp. PRF11 TaxID=2962593 RepID=UPI002881B90E|nr:helix-turn-helix domain-containing protein [Microbacterium sp. PRF11]MDT0116441.1 helix-turn-helix domain-containing protein [Microbacterium sp. PRF11]
MDFRFLWNVLRQEAREQQLLALSEDVATVWEAVELHTSHIQAAYIDELVAMNRQLEIERASLFRRLLLGETRDTTQLAHLASALNLAVDAPYVVVVAAAQYSDAFRRWTRAHARNNELLAIDGTQFVLLDTSSPGAPSMEDIATAPAGISPILDGLSEVGAGWNTARDLSNAVDSPNKAATLQSHWPTLVRSGLGESWSMMRRSLTSNLDALPPGKRAAILESVRVFMANGSVGETAAALFIHRNTLLKRLQRLQELTGLDVTVPNDAALIALAIEQSG